MMQGGGGGGGLPSLSELLNSKPTDSNQSAKLPSLSELLKSSSNASTGSTETGPLCTCNTAILGFSNSSYNGCEKCGKDPLGKDREGRTAFLSLKELGSSPVSFTSLGELSKSPSKFTPLNKLSNSPKGFTSLSELSKSPGKFTSLSELGRSPKGFTPLSELSKAPGNFSSLSELSRKTDLNTTSIIKSSPLKETDKISDLNKEKIKKPIKTVQTNNKDSLPSLLSLLAIENEKDVLGNTTIPKLQSNKTVDSNLSTLQTLSSMRLNESYISPTKSSAVPVQTKTKKSNMSKPSKFAQVIGAKPQKTNRNVDEIRNKLIRTYNLSSSTEILLRGVTSYTNDDDNEIFSFSTPSPDDVVVNHQEKAYQRDY